MTPAKLEEVDRLVNLANACLDNGMDPMVSAVYPNGIRGTIRLNALKRAADLMGISYEREPQPDDLPEDISDARRVLEGHYSVQPEFTDAEQEKRDGSDEGS